jgi:ABC-2 type transport system ATP-binding protein
MTTTTYNNPAGLGLRAAGAAPPPSVSLQGITLGYGRQQVLDGLDWSLLPGQVVGLLGRNGAGKTTLLEALLGLREPQAGQVLVFGQPVQALDDAARARIGYVPQQSDLFDWLTPKQLLVYFRSFYPRWNQAKVDGLMGRWQIDADKPIGRLSGGQQQRLSIIRALAHEPDLLVLDEPVASLDPAGRRDFLRELVEQVLDRGTTVVFSTHILSDLERVAFNLAFLGLGRIVLQAPLDELLDSTRRLIGPAALLAPHLAGAHILHRQAEPGQAREQVLARYADPRALPVGGPGVLVEPVTLEDLYLGLTT